MRVRSGRVVEVRAEGGRAVVARGSTGMTAGVPPAPQSAPQSAAPDLLARLPAGLAADLREWGRVVGSLEAGSTVSPASVSRRGRALAARVSVALGVAVDYLDPVSGHRVALRAVTRTPRPPPVPLLGARTPSSPPAPGEPTPWATGLTLSALTAGLVLLANLALAAPMVASLGGLGVLVDVLVAAGLVPALWLNRRVPTWRWAVWGTLAGMALAVPFLAVQAFGA